MTLRPRAGWKRRSRSPSAIWCPPAANLIDDYDTFAELVVACEEFCERVNGRAHRETSRAPADMVAEERRHLHVLPADAHTSALGETRRVEDDQTIRFGSVRYSTPDGYQGVEVWCRVAGDELVITAHTNKGLAEITRHRLYTPGHPRIIDAHYPHHRPGNRPRTPRPKASNPAEEAFLATGRRGRTLAHRSRRHRRPAGPFLDGPRPRAGLPGRR